MIGRTLAHYQITAAIGAGGMGEVYRATDTKLGREVALKVLPAEMAASVDRLERFQREAKALAALDHPGIVTVYSVEEADDVHFLTMQLVEGESLARLIPERGMSAEQTIAIGTALAEALAAAHEKGIIHRDLKPANVMLTRAGQVKVLDFGLAKMTEPAPGEGVDSELQTLAETRAGMVVGTLPYMSPEQVGSRRVDHRTDLFSLGAVLYEMATGRRPFPEEQGNELVASILTRDPVPPSKLNSRVPPGLEAIIVKALEKAPERRYQSAYELRADLEILSATGTVAGVHPRNASRRRVVLWSAAAAALVGALVAIVGFNVGGLRDRWFGPGGTPRIRSLAVLPLENLSADPNQAYFADGMTEELTTDLAKISALRVISRISTMRYKNSKEPLPQIAKELNVDAVIEGSVLREGNRVRITAQLIDAKTSRDLWADSYERELRSVLSLQSEIARAVAARVRVTVTPAERSQLVNARPVKPEAYEAYLKGKFFFNKMTPQGFEKGLDYMKQAIKLDPKSPLPYAGLALGYSRIGHERSPELLAKAKAAALKAEELGGPSAEMYLALGTVKLGSEWDFPGAGKDLRRAVELNPSIGEAHRMYSWYLVMDGQPEKALMEMRRAQEVEPLAPLFAADRAWQEWALGRFDDAISSAKQALELQPDFNEGLAALGFAYDGKGMFAEAIKAHQRLAATDAAWKWLLPYTYAKAGRKEKAREVMAKFMAEKPAPTGRWAGWSLAAAYTALGDKDEAFHWLDKCVRARQAFCPWLWVDPRFVTLHSDPRFHDLVQRIGLPNPSRHHPGEATE